MLEPRTWNPIINTPRIKTAKKSVRRVSKKRSIQLAEYNKTKAGWLPLHPTCEIGPRIRAAGFAVACTGKTTHVHHVCHRVGAMLNDTRYWLASCSGECHPSWCHDTHVKEARELGLI